MAMTESEWWHLHRILVRSSRTAKRRDEGGWRDRDLQALARRGYDAIVYLNRYEGIPLEEFEAARSQHADIDGLSDSRFRKSIPSADTSLIILDPAIVTVVEIRRL